MKELKKSIDKKSLKISSKLHKLLDVNLFNLHRGIDLIIVCFRGNMCYNKRENDPKRKGETHYENIKIWN